MELTNQSSFSHLTTLNLPHPYALHPSSLNPTMDVMVLLRSSLPSDRFPTGPMQLDLKIMKREQALKSRGKSVFALWRVNVSAGGMVWEVEVPGGKVIDICWSIDGQLLTILLSDESTNSNDSPTLRRVLLSVHDGSVVHATDLTVKLPRYMLEKPKDGVKMQWWKTDAEWTEAQLGSGRKVDEQIPNPSLVAPFVPFEQLNQRTTAAAPSVTPQPHHLLTNFPCILPSTPAHLLKIDITSNPSLVTLAGQFPYPSSASGLSRIAPPEGSLDSLTSPPVEPIVRLAQSATRIKSLLDTVLKGLEVCEKVWREGCEKNARVWMAELDSCGDDHGANFAATHADLTRLLLTGKSGDAVTQFIGGRLTDRTMTKWEQSYLHATRRMHTILTQSVVAACERIILHVEDMIGWALVPEDSQLGLKKEDLNRCLAWVRSLALKALALDRETMAEMARFREFAKWLKFELVRSSSQEPDDDPNNPSTHDILLVSEYLESGLINSPLEKFFLTGEESRSGEYAAAELPVHQPVSRPLMTVLDDALASVKSSGPKGMLPSPRDRNPQTMLSPVLGTGEFGKPASLNVDISPSKETSALWPIAEQAVKSLRQVCEMARDDDSLDALPPTDLFEAAWMGTFTEHWSDEKTRHIAGILDPAHSVIFITQVDLDESDPGHLTIHTTAVDLSRYANGDTKILTYRFIDSDELGVIVERAGARYLITFRYKELEAADTRQVASDDWSSISFYSTMPTISLPPARVRQLNRAPPVPEGQEEIVELAANGRKGRRMVCVSMGDRKEIECFDLDEDEGDDEEVGHESGISHSGMAVSSGAGDGSMEVDT